MAEFIGFIIAAIGVAFVVIATMLGLALVAVAVLAVLSVIAKVFS